MFAIGLACCLLSLPAAAQSWAMEPGVGVGPVKLGDTPTQVGQHLKSSDLVGTQKAPFFIYYGEEFIVQYEVQKVVMVSVHSNQPKTPSGAIAVAGPSGFAIGTPFSVVESTWGRDYIMRQLKTARNQPAEYYYAYNRKGAGFRVRGNRVVQIDIFAKN